MIPNILPMKLRYSFVFSELLSPPLSYNASVVYFFSFSRVFSIFYY